MATIQDVAAKAGVSVATVSRVINNSNAVAKKSIDKVNQAIQELGYQPNFLARDLRRAETNRILVLLQTISNPYYATIVKGIEDIAQKYNYNIMLCNTDSDMKREKAYIDMLGKKVVEGAIFLDTEMKTEELNAVAQYNHVVLCCEYVPGIHISHVMIDNYTAAKNIVRHLISLGHTRIGLIGGDKHLSSTSLRFQGYLDAQKEAQITIDEELIFWSECSSFRMGMRGMESLLYTSKRPTAIFAMSDILAIGAMKTIGNKGLSIPEDIAVAGFDGIEYAAVTMPGLTTVVQPTYEMGCTAMEILIKEMKSDTKNIQEIVLEHEVVIRESTVKSMK